MELSQTDIFLKNEYLESINRANNMLLTETDSEIINNLKNLIAFNYYQISILGKKSKTILVDLIEKKENHSVCILVHSTDIDSGSLPISKVFVKNTDITKVGDSFSIPKWYAKYLVACGFYIKKTGEYQFI